MKRSKGLKFLLVLLFMCFLAFLVCKANFTFKIKGDKNININLGEQYNDTGITAKFFNQNIENKVKINSNLDLKKVGNYSIIYSINILGRPKKLVRNIHILDNDLPKIELSGPNPLYLDINEEYHEPGYTATDNYDGNISDKVKILGNIKNNKPGKYELTYIVTDSSKNKRKTKRTVIVRKNIKNEIENYIKDNNLNVSLGYYNLTNEKTYFYRENELYYGASLIKTLDSLYLYNHDLVNNDTKEHIKRIITQSSNSSHQYLVNLIGRENLKQYGISLGAPHTLQGGDNFGDTTVKDQIIYFKEIYKLIQKESELKNYFINSKCNYLKIDNVDTLCKYGYYDVYFHNAGIVLDEQPYIVVILTKHGNTSSKIINNLSKLIYEYHKQEKLFN